MHGLDQQIVHALPGRALGILQRRFEGAVHVTVGAQFLQVRLGIDEIRAVYAVGLEVRGEPLKGRSSTGERAAFLSDEVVPQRPIDAA